MSDTLRLQEYVRCTSHTKAVWFALLIVSLSSVLPPQKGNAQENMADRVLEIRRAYEQLNYEEAERKGLAALEDYQAFSPDELCEIHTILALVYFSENNATEAGQQFRLALDLNPDLELDPLFVSPKIREFFAEIKAAQTYPDVSGSTDGAEVRYMILQDPRPAAALRSMVLPGWGQMYKGESRKGIVLTALWGVGVLGTATAHLLRQSAEDDYLAETDPRQIQNRYDDFNRMHKLRNNLALFAAGLWLVSYLDAILGKAPETSLSRTERTVSPILSGDRLAVGLSLRL